MRQPRRLPHRPGHSRPVRAAPLDRTRADRAVPVEDAMSPRRAPAQRGQVLVMAAAVLAFLLVPLTVFLVDTGLVEASYAQLGETLHAAVEDGASQIDVPAFRESGGQPAVLDQAAARQTAERALQASGLPGLDAVKVIATATTVTATATVHVRLLVVGSANVTQTRSAGVVLGGWGDACGVCPSAAAAVVEDPAGPRHRCRGPGRLRGDAPAL